jgi:hypothetical protein
VRTRTRSSEVSCPVLARGTRFRDPLAVMTLFLERRR